MSEKRNFRAIFFTILTTSILTGCLKADETRKPFGPEESPNDIAVALNTPFANLDPASIALGEFVHVETNQAINGGTLFVTKDTGITVIQRNESSEQIDLTLAIQEIEYDSDGNGTQSIFEDDLTIFKATASSASAKATSNNPLAAYGVARTKQLQAQADPIVLCDAVNNPDVTYHNLQVENVLEPVPELVEGSAFCGGQSNCVMNVTKVRFDQVIWSGEQGDKITCEFTVSGESPFLAAQMRNCLTLVVPIDGINVLLTECSEVRNFQFGN